MKKLSVISRLRKTASRVIAWAEALLFPEGVLCLSCGRAPEGELEDGLCEACTEALEALRAKQEAYDRCDARELPAELSYVHAAFPYENPAKKLITTLKFDRVRSAAIPLIRAMAMLASGEEDLIVPVPTTKRRHAERGFNQAALLAEGIGKELGMPVLDALERIGEQEAQSTLSASERLNNLSGCMGAKHRLDGRRVVLVDDVYATGATAREAARALYEAGAVSVGLFAAARSSPEDQRPEFLKVRLTVTAKRPGG